MSTDYVVSTYDDDELRGGQVELSVIEHSGRFDLSVSVGSVSTTDAVIGATAGEMAEVALKILRAVAYNTDAEKFKAWLTDRVRHVDDSTYVSPFTLD